MVREATPTLLNIEREQEDDHSLAFEDTGRRCLFLLLLHIVRDGIV